MNSAHRNRRSACVRAHSAGVGCSPILEAGHRVKTFGIPWAWLHVTVWCVCGNMHMSVQALMLRKIWTIRVLQIFHPHVQRSMLIPLYSIQNIVTFIFLKSLGGLPVSNVTENRVGSVFGVCHFIKGHYTLSNSLYLIQPYSSTTHTCDDITWFTSTLFTSYHIFVCTLHHEAILSPPVTSFYSLFQTS